MVALPARRSRRPRQGSTPPSAHTSNASSSRVAWASSVSLPSACGSSHRGADAGDHVAAEGLLLVEHRRDGGRRARSRCPAAWRPRSSYRGRRRSRTGAAVVSPASTSMSTSSTTTAVILKSLARAIAGQASQGVQVDAQLQVVEAASSRARSVVWSCRVGSLSSTYRFWIAGRRITCRPTPTVAALGRVDQRRDLDGEVMRRLGEAGQPPAVLELLGCERTDVEPRDRYGARQRP